MKKEFELAIIGAGIAGVSAAVYAKRAGLDVVVFEPKVIGGQLLLMETVDNYTGVALGTKGRELAALLTNTLSQFNIEIIREEVIKFEPAKDQIKLHTADSLFSAKTSILATGASFKTLGLSKEKEFTGKGISYCAVCDGFFFKNKTVAVVGGGNTAVEEALYLSNICSKVYVIHRRNQLRAVEYLQKELHGKKNVTVVFDSIVDEIKGEDFLSELVLKNVNTGNKTKLSLSGLFVAVGVKANTEIFKNIISLNEAGFILTDEEMKTSCVATWAAGDCRKRPLRQLVTASAEGAMAAVSVYKYLKGGYISS